MKSNKLGERTSAAKEKIRVADAWRLLNLPHPPRAGNICVKSPFRPEKSASFSIFAEGRAFKDQADDTAKGDVINFIMIAAHCDNGEAIRLLLNWAGDHEPLGHRKHAGAIVGLRKADALVVAPPPPPPPPIDPEDVTEDDPRFDPLEGIGRSIRPGIGYQLVIAKSRGLASHWRKLDSLCSVGILRTSDDRDEWLLVDGPQMPRGWMLAEYRNISRKAYGNGAKCFTAKNSKKGWPVGLSLASGDPNQILLVVEGGPDFLAANVLVRHLRRPDVLPIAIMGREITRLVPEAQRALAGRCVHIISHRDKSASGGLTDGRDAAVKWTDMLVDDCGVGSVTWSPLVGLTRPDGQPATDLCEAVEDGGIERNGAHWDDLMPDRNQQEASTISNNGL